MVAIKEVDVLGLGNWLLLDNVRRSVCNGIQDGGTVSLRK